MNFSISALISVNLHYLVQILLKLLHLRAYLHEFVQILL